MNDTITNATVQVSWQPTDRQPNVNPTDATISTQGRVTWQITLPKGYTLQIEFAVKGGVKGPFPVNGQPDNPSQGLFEGAGGSAITSAPSTAADNTEWKYGVGVYQGSSRVSYVDPRVIIKNN